MSSTPRRWPRRGVCPGSGSSRAKRVEGRRFPGREHRGDCRILRGFRVGARRCRFRLRHALKKTSLSPFPTLCIYRWYGALIGLERDALRDSAPEQLYAFAACSSKIEPQNRRSSSARSTGLVRYLSNPASKARR